MGAAAYRGPRRSRDGYACDRTCTNSEVALSESIHPLVHARWIEDREVQRQRFADPDSKRSVIGEIVVGQGVDERGESGRLDQLDNGRQCRLEEVDLELRLGMWPHVRVA